jgi:molybdopterin-guanine dinucleotide biosynthesis protein
MSHPDSSPATDVRTGVLLAGGAARRMRTDKRTLTLAGRSLLARGIGFLRNLFPVVAVSVAAQGAPDLGDNEDLVVVPDAFSGSSPLVGIASALQALQEPVFVCAVDLAFPDQRLARQLLEASAATDVCLPQVGDNLEPLFAVYRPTCLGPMRRLLQRGEHRIVASFPELCVRTVPCSDRTLFLNINTPDDYAMAANLARSADGPERPALVGVVGKSDSGKTTLIERLIPELKRLGLRVATVKHDAHSFEIDHPGKDSYRHGAAGAEAYVVSSPSRVAYVGSVSVELSLQQIVARFFRGMDLIVAEGYKRSAPHRVEIFRRDAGHTEPLCGPGEALALVTDADLPHPHKFALDDAAGLAAFLALRLDTLRKY